MNRISDTRKLKHSDSHNENNSIKFIMTALLITAVFITMPLISANMSFSDPDIKIGNTPDGEIASDMNIAVDKNGNLYAVWSDSRNPGGWDLYFSKSTDGGNTWSQEEIVNENVFTSADPWMLIDENNIYMAWSQGDGAGHSYINFDMSPLDNIDFSGSDIMVSSSLVEYRHNPKIVSDGINLYISWVDGRSGDRDIYFDYSPISELNFSGEDHKVNTDTSTEDQYFHDITTDGTNVYIIWHDERDGDDNVFMDYSPVSAIDFSSEDIPVSSITNSWYEGKPAITTDGQYLFVAYSGETNIYNKIYFDVCPITNIDFSGEDIEITTGSDHDATEPFITNDGENIYVAWQSRKSTPGYNIYFDWSPISNLDFSSEDIKINTDATEEEHENPILTFYDDGTDTHVYVAWEDRRSGDKNIFFASAVVGGSGQGNDDTVPPVITHSAITSGTAGKPITISASITDNVKVSGSKLYYRNTGSETYSTLAMLGIGDTFSAEIPASAVSIAGVEYYLEATDGANTVTHPAVEPETKPHTVIVTRLSPPTELSAIAGEKRINLSWNEVTDAAGYNIYRSTSSNGEFTMINTEKIVENSYSDSAVDEDVKYYYYVKSVDSGELESGQSNTASASINGDGDGDNSDSDKNEDKDNTALFLLAVGIIIVIVVIIIIASVLKKSNRNM